MDTIAFFNHKGGVGKTTMLFNVGIELGRLGKRVLMVDYDAQANLSAIALGDDVLEDLYAPGAKGMTVAHAFSPLVSAQGDVDPPPAIEIRDDEVWLIPGDINLSAFEDILPTAWPEAVSGRERGYRVTSAPYRLAQEAGEAVDAEYVLIDLGPNVGPLNRAVILGSDYLLVPIASDLFSLRALPSVGQSVRTWIREWQTALGQSPDLPFPVQHGKPRLLGYVSQQFNIYRGEATQAFSNWIAQIPDQFEKGLVEPLREYSDGDGGTLADPADSAGMKVGDLKNFHSLVPEAQNVRRAIFELTQNEVIGNQLTRARDSEKEFRKLARAIIKRTA
jgi:chromosome partitioning protein